MSEQQRRGGLTVSFISQHLRSSLSVEAVWCEPGLTVAAASHALLHQSADKSSWWTQSAAGLRWEQSALMSPEDRGESNSFRLIALYCPPLIAQLGLTRSHWWRPDHMTDVRSFFRGEKCLDRRVRRRGIREASGKTLRGHMKMKMRCHILQAFSCLTVAPFRLFQS